jgi:lipoprotein signal peptidase
VKKALFHYKNLTWLILSLLIILLDQVSKYYAVRYLSFAQPLVIMPHYFNLFLIHNTGASFSFLAEMSGWQRWFLSFTAGLISLGLIGWLSILPKNQHWLAAALSLIIGGAMGNLIDRLQLAYVIDFIQVYAKNYYFPTFNIADTAVVIGVFMLAYSSFYGEKSHVK